MQSKSGAILHRAFGREVEYATAPRTELDRDSIFPNDFWHLLEGAALPNGGRIYRDGTHHEYATPEVRSLVDLVRYEWAGNRIYLDCLKRAAVTRDNGFDRNLYPNNRNVDPLSNAAFGSHENYQYACPTSEELVVTDALAPFLCLRSILTGAGGVIYPNAPRGERFGCSPRAAFVGTEERGSECATDKIKDEGDGQRVQISTSDGQATQYGSYLVFGLTHIFLCLYEDGHLHPRTRLGKLFSYRREYFYDDLSSIASRTGSWRIEGMEKPHMRDGVFALRTLLEYARSVYREPNVTKDMKDCILLSLSLLKRLEHFRGEVTKQGFSKDDLTGVREFVPWASKLHYLEGMTRAFQKGLTRSERRSVFSSAGWLSHELAYHHSDPEISLASYFTYGKGRDSEFSLPAVVNERSIKKACFHPPNDTRAAVRGAAVRAADRLCAESGADHPLIQISWGSLHLPDLKVSEKISDPGNPYPELCDRLNRL